MIYTEEQRKRIIAESKGKIVESLEYVEDQTTGNYWVMHFTNGTEASFRWMTELMGVQKLIGYAKQCEKEDEHICPKTILGMLEGDGEMACSSHNLPSPEEK